MRSKFEKEAIELFRRQYLQCKPYRRFVDLLKVDPDTVNSLNKIPFLPVELFKTEDIITGDREPEMIFTSSSTTGTTPSRHLITDIELYRRNFSDCFRHFYGEPSEYTILALLPSYLEREGSSLVYMVDELIKLSGESESGYYLRNYSELLAVLQKLKSNSNGKRCLLIGVSFALLEFAEEYSIEFPDLIVMETGGMKGQRKEIARSDLHDVLKSCFGVGSIHSEYGMAELLSQAYSKGDGVFETPPQMHIMVRDLNNPFKFVEEGRVGGINIIDLANCNSCAFIETQDMGEKKSGNRFTIAGRIQNAELRGCNLLIE